VKYLDYGTHLFPGGSVTREPMGWWTIEIDDVRERGTEYGGEYTYWIGRFSEPFARLLAQAVGERIRATPDDEHNGRCWLVDCGAGLEIEQRLTALEVDD